MSFKNDREWFDEAYDFIRGRYPFGWVVGKETSLECIRASFPKMSLEEAKSIKDEAMKFGKYTPSHDSFFEEKNKILTEISPLLKEEFPFATSAITFGKTIGDIDIGLICDEFPYENYEDLKTKHQSFFSDYPIVDRGALWNLRVKDGKDLAKTIVCSQMNGCPDYFMFGFDKAYKPYFQAVFSTGKLIFGKKREVRKFKRSLNLAIKSIDSYLPEFIERTNARCVRYI